MKNKITDFIKNHDYLVCVDSDGCAMNTMDVKHMKCFGPKAIEEWGLHHIEERFMEVWNNVNLYSKTRGINRFKGLVRVFELLDEEGLNMPEYSAIAEWTRTSPELSNPALEREIAKSGNTSLTKTLSWSNKVNQAISEMHEEDKPFPKVKEGLKVIQQKADIAVVSSANGGALLSEWTRHELTNYITVLLGQEAGSKAFCINELKKHGFSNQSVLMVGDAPGDLDAAQYNDVFFYPILVGKEEFSWERLASEAFLKFIEGSFIGDYQQQLINEFQSNLK